MEWALWFSFSLFLAVNSFFRSWYLEGGIGEATLLGPGGRTGGPVKSALGQGHGVVVRKVQIPQIVTALEGFATLRWNSGEGSGLGAVGFQFGSTSSSQETLKHH